MTDITQQQPTLASQPSAPRSSLFTCLACHVAFHTAENQRNHYRTDWHRYNLKRKVAELPPVSAEQFAQKILAQQAKDKEQAGKNSFQAECEVCSKVYSTENAHTNHLQSKKHKETEQKAAELAARRSLQQASAPTTPTPKDDASSITTARTAETVSLTVTDETTEAEMLSLIDKKIETSARLTDQDCLFCSARSATFDANMTHMTKAHSFFIPDLEYLVDLAGLIRYLGEKVSVGNVCLYCNGKGRGMRSLKAVQKHMVDKGHCKIAYDAEDDIMEVVDFYDFTSSYPDAEGNTEMTEAADDTAKAGAETELVGGKIELGEDEMELILPSGARIGHRSLARYYKQSLRPEESRDSVLINRLITQYDADSNFASSGYQRTGSGPRARFLITDGRTGARGPTEAYQASRHDFDFRARIGIKANKLQHHYREQIL
ncbi:C2H2 type zinc-finger-domain-containing protein [Jimgerdemannia flammicorona]|uniref:C2H2 type zinc-finger-domain-containing protein n=1 Tax=Jimgerdemannia flammicorona TaxID=994334 RepID=A0A433QNK8_9FUNG|nr:C2H2 type zinc-finger-domain-containing protein [Jimgerdemannia flammicorona]